MLVVIGILVALLWLVAADDGDFRAK